MTSKLIKKSAGESFDLYPESDPASPFFIIGSSRSGSTLLSRMLNCHPRLAVPPESHLFNTFYALHHYYGDLARGRNQARLVDDILSTFQVRTWSPPLKRESILSRIESPTFAGIMDAMMRSWAHNQGKQRWGEKTPHHIFYWREILECFPHARLIHLVRDGRDVASSYVQARFGSKTIYAAAKRWVRWLDQIERIKESVDPTAFLEVRYEDVLMDPETNLANICHFLGEDYSSAMLEFHKMPLSPNVVDEPNKQNLRNPLLPDNSQKWRHHMSKSQLRIFESIAQPTLLRYRYQTAFDMRPALSIPERFYRETIESPLLKGIAMLKNRPGHLDELSRLRIRLRLLLFDRFRNL